MMGARVDNVEISRSKKASLSLVMIFWLAVDAVETSRLLQAKSNSVQLMIAMQLSRFITYD